MTDLPGSEEARLEPPACPALARLEPIARGKIRHLYRIDHKRLLMVATDRLSAFDVVFPDPVRGKGRVLTDLSRFWFQRTRTVVPNHLLATPPEDILGANAPPWLLTHSLVVERLEPLPIEAIVRAYLAGSAWNEYRKSGRVSDVELPKGLRLGDPLPSPLFTPSWKAPAGAHDRPVDEREYIELAGGPAAAETIRHNALTIFALASRHAAARGIILADTKFEFGRRADGTLVLIDELLTPDSSRYWDAQRWSPGSSPPSYDKQPIRDYLEGLGWDKTPPPPPLPASLLEELARRYETIALRLKGETTVRRSIG